MSALITGVRSDSRPPLARHVLSSRRDRAAQGTTTVEVQPRVVLDAVGEAKALEALKAAQAAWRGTAVRTLLGAHVVPPEFRDNRADYVRAVCQEMIPTAARHKLAHFVDVFIERGAFTLEEARQVF